MAPATRSALLLAAWLTAGGCVGSGEIDTLLVGRIVRADGTPHPQVLVAMEQGPLHFDNFTSGVLTDDEGDFEIELPGGGEWGLHVYVSPAYTYLPMEIYVLPHSRTTVSQANIAWLQWEDSTGLDVDIDWPTQPDEQREVALDTDGDATDNPVVWDPRVTRVDAELVEVELEAWDPNANLTQILAFNSVTGSCRMMDPPGAIDDKLRPNGTYSMRHYLDPREETEGVTWYFVAADFECNNSRIVPLRWGGPEASASE